MMNLGVVVYLRDSFSSEADRISNSYGKMTNSITGLNSVIGNSMYQTWNGVSLMAKGAAASLPLAFSVVEAAKFEKKLAAIQTVWEYNNESADVQAQKISEISQQIRDLSLDIGTDPVDTASGMYTILQANITDTAEALAILGLAQQSAIAGLTSTEDASKVLISLRNAYGLTGDEMETVTDQLFQALAVGVMNFDDFGRSLGKSIGIVRQAGLELPEYFALKATATLSGMTAPQTDSGIRQALQELFQPKEKATVEMLQEMVAVGALPEDFEFSTKYMNEGAGSFHAFLEEIYAGATRVEEIGTMLDKNGLSMTADKIMGRLFNDMEGLAFVLNVVGDQGDQYQSVLDQILDSEGKLEDSFSKIADTVTHKWEKLRATLKNFMIVVGTPLLGLVGSIIEALTHMLKALTHLFEKFPFLSYVLFAVSAAITALFVTFGTIIAGMGIYTLLIMAVARVFPIIATKLAEFFLFAKKKILPLSGLLIFLAIASYLLYKAWTENWGGMRDGITTFWNRVKLVGRGLMELIDSTKDGVGSMSEETAAALERAGLFDFVVTLYMWWYRLKALWDGFKEGFMSVIDGYIDTVRNMADSTNPIIKKIGDALMWTVDLLTGVRPSDESVEQFRNIGKWLGRVVAISLSLQAVFAMMSSTAKILAFLAAPFKILWSVIKLAAWALGGLWKLMKLLPATMLWNAFLSIYTFLWEIGSVIVKAIGQVWKLFKGVWGTLLKIGRALWFAVQVVGAFLGVTAGWALVIIAAVALAVGLIIYYWDEIAAFFVGLWDRIVTGAQNAWDWFVSTWAPVGQFFVDLWNGIAGAAETAWLWMQDTWSAATEWFGNLWSDIAGPADEAWTGVTDTADAAWSGVENAWGQATEWFDGIWSPIAETASGVWSDISGFALATWEFLRGIWVIAVVTFTQAWQVIAGLAEVAWGYVQAAWSVATAFFGELWSGIVSIAGAVWQQVCDYAAVAWELIQGIWSFAVEWFDTTWSTLVSVASGAWDLITEYAGIAWDFVTALWSTLSAWFQETWDATTAVAQGAWEVIAGAADTAWSFLTGMWYNLDTWFDTEVLEPLQESFDENWEAISGYAQSAWDWVAGIWNTAYSWFDTYVLTPFLDGFMLVWNWIELVAQETWTALQDIWSAVTSWFDTYVISPMVELWNTIEEAVTDAATAAYDAFTDVMGGLAGWFQENVIDPIAGGWDWLTGTVTGAREWVGDRVDDIREAGRTGEYNGQKVLKPMPEQPKTPPPKADPQQQPNQVGGPRGMATGGYIKPGAEGLAYLHEDELVINSPTYNRLKRFLDEPEASVAVEAPEPQDPMPYRDRLADHKEHQKKSEPKEDHTLTQMMGQMQQMIAAVQQMADRPVHVTSHIDGREIGRSVDAYNRERDARRY